MSENRPGGTDDKHMSDVKIKPQSKKTDKWESAVIFCKGQFTYRGKEHELMNDLDTFIPPYSFI